jgi:hypothetical protein
MNTAEIVARIEQLAQHPRADPYVLALLDRILMLKIGEILGPNPMPF